MLDVHKLKENLESEKKEHEKTKSLKAETEKQLTLKAKQLENELITYKVDYI